MHAREHRTALGQLLFAALCWSLGGLLIKAVDWPPLAVAGGRGFIAAVFLIVTTRGRLRFTWSPVQLGAAVAYAGCTATFVLATKLTTAANAVLLQYTAPVWVALLGAWLLHERPTRADFFAILAALGGMGLFFADRLDLTNLLGNAVGIFSGICFAVMAVLLRKQKDGSPLESIILGNLLACALGVPAMLGAPLPSATGAGALVLLGIVQLGVSYHFYARAIRHLTALEAVLVPVIEPILNPLWVFLVLGERPGHFALAGGALVLLAVTARSWWSLRPTPAPSLARTTA
ncbi:DMT family transporter [Horticoccus luteus]|uniref:DMT family transporter n=1 Tax=Horticoccus luteus TaxID=2862869 RepID=A0A8F9TW79_9BACT|nr:DMT family transporter [Horticoccus luteus]QYM78934.1 DMT family transporter [Horticoccus luteus]